MKKDRLSGERRPSGSITRRWCSADGSLPWCTSGGIEDTPVAHEDPGHCCEGRSSQQTADWQMTALLIARDRRGPEPDLVEVDRERLLHRIRRHDPDGELVVAAGL